MAEDEPLAILDNSLLNAVADTLGLSQHVRRIIIDLNVNHAPALYIEQVGDERLHEIDFSALKGVAIRPDAAACPEDRRNYGRGGGPWPMRPQQPPEGSTDSGVAQIPPGP